MKTILLISFLFGLLDSGGKFTKKIFINNENCVAAVVEDTLTMKRDTISFEENEILWQYYSSAKETKLNQ